MSEIYWILVWQVGSSATKEVALAFAGLTASAADDKQLFEDDDRGIPEGRSSGTVAVSSGLDA